MKAKDQMKWVRKMNNISNIADEIVLNMYVYDD
ncbi:MAG: TnpV protein [Clostridia bacterium]|nr:TnpV protein [Clostridia bacterium]